MSWARFFDLALDSSGFSGYIINVNEDRELGARNLWGREGRMVNRFVEDGFS